MPDVKPTIFISHKHSDVRIAQVIAAFCDKKAGGRLQIFLSSDPDFKGPRLGKNLNTELRKTLWGTDVLLLVYTSANDYDWSYCMWECGVANDSKSPDTNIIVFQCGTDSPPILNDATRVKPRDDKQLKGFVNQFLRGEDFFPSLEGRPLLTDYKDNYVAEDAKELFNNFAAVLPKDGGASEEWPTWPYLRIELPQGDVEKMQNASEADRSMLANQLVKDFGVVVDSDARAAQLFGQSTFPKGMKLGALLKTWQDKNPSLEPSWFDSISEQMMTGAAKGFPTIRWTQLREADRDADYTPVVSRIKSRPYSAAVQFDVYFYNLRDRRTIPVATEMVPISDLFYKQIGQIDPESLKLKDLISELKLRGRNRVPILSSESFPLYMVHRSMIEQFVVNNLFAQGEATNVSELTLAELLADPELKKTFENTFVVVKRQATLAEAHSAMVTKPNCSDVFITTNGTLKEPVQGWLSNVDLARSG
jgi:hypothetical protein